MKSVDALRQQALAAGWTRERLVAEIRQRLGVSVLQAHRLASGRTQAETAEALREIYKAQHGHTPKLSHQQVSKWEKGLDKPEKYMDALCQLYSTRPDLLGFGRDYGSAGTAEEPRIPRRSLISLPVGVAASHSLAELEAVRLRLDGMLQMTASPDRTLEHWEQEIRHYGVQIRVMDPNLFLVQATNAMKSLCDLFELRQSLENQRRLGESIARLAGLIALVCNASGQTNNMHDWFHLAQTLADECSDRTVRAWATAYEAMSHLWHGRNLYRALDLAERACKLAPVGSTSAPLATAIQARALARVGRAKEALIGIDKAETMWSQLGTRQQTEENTFGFYEHLLRMYQSDVLTVLGVDFKRAHEVQQRAIELARSKPADIDTALIRLDSAVCLAKQNELDQARQAVRQALHSVPEGFRSGTAAQKARAAMDLIVAQGGARLVRELEEMLRAAA